MKNAFVLLIFACAVVNVSAQYSFFEPPGSFAIEVSLENTPYKRLPIYRNSISSLAVIGDVIYGGTNADNGLSPFIFTASIQSRELTAFTDVASVVKGQSGIITGFHRSGNSLFAGTMPAAGNSGHLLQIVTSATGIEKVVDLGEVVSREGVFALTCDSTRNILYGITHPTGIFFSYQITSRQIKRYDRVVPSKETAAKLSDEFGLTAAEYLCKALQTDNEGNVYGSLPVNRLFYFAPSTETFTLLEDSIPDVWGRNVLGQVESWAKSPDGKLYGGNAGDGQLFTVDPLTKKIKNLGKPVMATRLRGLAFGKDGKLYGIAGSAPGYSHLFTFSNNEGFRDYGNPQFKMKAPGLEQGIDWRGFQLGSITSSSDGKYIVIGEDESLSQLLVFPVQ